MREAGDEGRAADRLTYPGRLLLQVVHVAATTLATTSARRIIDHVATRAPFFAVIESA
jgi:hypothetical protein